MNFVEGLSENQARLALLLENRKELPRGSEEYYAVTRTLWKYVFLQNKLPAEDWEKRLVALQTQKGIKRVRANLDLIPGIIFLSTAEAGRLFAIDQGSLKRETQKHFGLQFNKARGKHLRAYAGSKTLKALHQNPDFATRLKQSAAARMKKLHQDPEFAAL